MLAALALAVLAAPAPAEGPGEIWRVKVVDEADRPLEGVLLLDPWFGDSAYGRTGVDGEATIHGPAEEQPDGERGFRVVTGGTVPSRDHVLTEPFTLLRVARGLPVEVELVNAVTGEPAQSACDLRAWSWFAPRGRLRGPASERTAPILGGRCVLPDSPFAAGDLAQLRFSASLAPGLAIEGYGGCDVDGLTSRRAESIRVRVPVRREASLRIRVEQPDGSPAAGVEVVETHLGWWRTPQQFRAEPSDQHGTIAVHGVPDLRGDLVVFRLRRGDAHWIAGPARLLGDGGSHVLDARPGQYRAPVGEVPRCGRNSRDPRPGSSALQGRVVRRDGVRADRVGLELSGNGPTMCGWDDARWERNVRTDAEGAFSIPELPEGAIEIVVNEIGMVQIRREVTLGAGEVLALELREPEGRSVTVHIVDPRGEPLPFAALEIDQEDGPEYALVEDGVQTLGILTGPDGVRALPDLSHVPVAVTARFGSRSATGRAGVDDESIEIVVPDATAED